MTTKPVYYSTTETAELVRTQLKEAFPGVKFGVRSKKYSGGSSIRVSWIDGPTPKEVNEVVSYFEGAVFDGMIDLKSYVTKVSENGVPVRFGADYVFTDRSYSVEFLSNILAQHPTADVEILPPSKFSGAYFMKVENAGWTRELQDNLDNLNRAARDTSAYVKPTEPTKPTKPVESKPVSSGVSFGEYKGHPTINLPLDGDNTFSFGVRKAQAILAYLEDIKRFVDMHS